MLCKKNLNKSCWLPSRRTVSVTALPSNALGKQKRPINIKLHLIWAVRFFCPTNMFTKVFTAEPQPSHLFSLLLWFYSCISFFSHCLLHSWLQLPTMTHAHMHAKREGERIKRRVKKSRKPRDTSSCLRVAVMFFVHICGFVWNNNRTSRGKIKSLFCWQNTETWPWVSKASEQHRMAME